MFFAANAEQGSASATNNKASFNVVVATPLMLRYTLLRKLLVKLLAIPLSNPQTVAKWLVISTNGVVAGLRNRSP